MKRLLLALSLALLPLGAETFEEYKANYYKELQDFEAMEESEFQAFREQQEKEFKAFAKEYSAIWGEEPPTPEKTKYVQYGKDLKSQGIIDFEKGTITLSVIKTAGEVKEKVDKRMKEQLRELLYSKGSQNIVTTVENEKKEKEKPASKSAPLLAGAIVDEKGKEVIPAPNVVETKESKKTQQEVTITKADVDKFIQQAVEKVKPVIAKIKGKEEEKVTITLNLAPNHVKKRANPYIKLVEKYSKMYNLDPARVFAMMHTESYFNPAARSHVNAIGLLQIVPTSGGRDAYKYVFKKDKIPTEEFLFNPENNIRLGCAYMNLLDTRYFQKVNNDNSRLYCSTAAYNTGAGNVAKAFTGKYNVHKATPLINTKSAKEVYNWLVTKLPYEETRHYVERVTERMKLYK